jgi:hypothetical protein
MTKLTYNEFKQLDEKAQKQEQKAFLSTVSWRKMPMGIENGQLWPFDEDDRKVFVRTSNRNSFCCLRVDGMATIPMAKIGSLPSRTWIAGRVPIWVCSMQTSDNKILAAFMLEELVEDPDFLPLFNGKWRAFARYQLGAELPWGDDPFSDWQSGLPIIKFPEETGWVPFMKPSRKLQIDGSQEELLAFKRLVQYGTTDKEKDS